MAKAEKRLWIDETPFEPGWSSNSSGQSFSPGGTTYHVRGIYNEKTTGDAAKPFSNNHRIVDET